VISEPIIVIDFETTGLDPSYDRATEVAAHRIVDGRIVDTFHSLINTGKRIPTDVERITGITNEMLVGQPKSADVFPALRDFIGDRAVFAHNAWFDFSFYQSELHRLGLARHAEKFLCTIALARRLTPGLCSYSLGIVASHVGVRFNGAAHRATADAEVCAGVLHKMCQRIAEFGVDPIDASLLKRIAAYTPTRNVGGFLKRHAEAQERHRGRRKVVATEPKRSTGVAQQLKGAETRSVRRWRIYPSGNLRDMARDVLYRRDQLAFVGGVDPLLMITTEAGEVRVPFRDVFGGDPRQILMATGRGGARADGANRSAAGYSVQGSPASEYGGAEGGATVSTNASRPALPTGWTYFSPPGATPHSRVASSKQPVEVDPVAPSFRAPDAALRELLTRRAVEVSAEWVYFRSQSFLLEVATQRVHQVYGWPAMQGAVTLIEVKGGVLVKVATDRMLSLPDP
jgi:DNA polymerase III subunit epsilon